MPAPEPSKSEMKMSLPLENSLDKSSTYGDSLEDNSFGDMSGLMSSMNPDMGVSHYNLGSTVDSSQMASLNMDAQQHMDKLDAQIDTDRTLKSKMDAMGSQGLPNIPSNMGMNMGAMNMGGMNMGGMNMGGMNMPTMGGSSGMGGMDLSKMGMDSGMGSMPNMSSLSSLSSGASISNMSGEVSDALKSLSNGSALSPLGGKANTNALDADSDAIKQMIAKFKIEEDKDAQHRALRIQQAKEHAFGLGNGLAGKETPKPKVQDKKPSKKNSRKLKKTKKKIKKKSNSKAKSQKRKLDQGYNGYGVNPYKRQFNIKLEHVPRRIKCSVTHRKVGKSFEIANKKKKEFCENARRKVDNYPLQDLYDYLENMKPTMMQLISVKRTFYCALCDQKKQENINTKVQTIAMTQGTCRTLVTQYQDYIKLHNVIFVKYFNTILQYARCFTTLPGEEHFPKKSLLGEKLTRIEYINRCFEHAEDPNFMDYCFFLCDQYSYTSLSGFFDGDVKFLRKINYFLLSFTRKYENHQPLTQEHLPDVTEFANVNFDDPQYMTEQDKEDVVFLGESDEEEPEEIDEDDIQPGKWDYQNEIEVDVDEPEQIYENSPIENIPDRLRPKFVNDYTAISPFDMVNKVDFDIPVEDLIQEQCNDGEEEEPLNRDVLQQYFSISQSDLDEFDNDLFLDFADYNYFKIEKKKKLEALEEVGRKPKDSEVEISKKAVKEYKEIRPYLGTIEGLTDDDPEDEPKVV